MDIRKMKILDAAIQNKFNINSYIAFLNELFKENIRFNRDLKFNPKVKGQFRQTVESFIDLGICKDTDGNILALAIVKLKSNHTVGRARAMQRNFIKDYFLELESGKKVALVAFFDDNSDDWRLSFVKIEAEIENDKLVKKITPAKRYSFLVGKNEKNHTAKKQLWNIFADDSKTPLISDIEQIFNIEKVTNEFYESYRQKYWDFKETLENQESFNELAERLEFTAEQYSKKLMGELVFLYFLQKKGWLGVRANPTRVEAADIEDLIGTNQEQEIFYRIYKLHNGSFIRNGNELKNLSDKEIEVLNNIFRNTKYAEKWGQGEVNFIRRIFNAAKDSEENFFKDYLEPLFYEALNDKRGGSTYYRKLNCLIPFLNGGLFKTINADYEWKDTHFVLKNNVFSNETLCKNGDIGDGILDVFDRYAFTVNEAEPLETDVAVDPEMLGKVFENLLDIKDRKSKGAFYTPREIVHYMCQESLINYLQTETQISYGDIEQLIRYGDIIADDDKSKNAQKTGKYLMPEAIRANSKKIDELLKDVKIADPAVGSGAFPLGMVNEILRARSNLNPYIYGTEISLYGNKFSIPMDRRPYQIKLDTIQNCIHAVDIEPSAVDIAKLRLWLSLIVDEENFKEIRPLPNLDYNIMCGNSLIDEFQGVKLFDERILDRTIGEKKDEAYEQIELLPVDKYDQLDIFGESNASRIMNEIRSLQKEFFSCVDENQRIEIKNKIDEYEFEFVKETLKENNQQDKIKDIEAMWKKNTKPYFLWKLYFADVFLEKGGFDIVIGNPPYLKERDNRVIFDLILQTNFGKQYSEGKMNYWYFFFYKGLEILKNNAHICYIAPNYYISGVGAKKLNNIIINKTHIKTFIDFDKFKIFETADIQCMIILCQNSTPDNNSSGTNIHLIRKLFNRDVLDNIMRNLSNNEYSTNIKVSNQKHLLSPDYKINFEYIKYKDILDKINSVKSDSGIYKTTQGIVENPSVLSKKNIETAYNKKYINKFDIEYKYFPGQEVFVLSKDTINNLHLNKEEETFLRNYYYPLDINKYSCEKISEKYLLYLTKENIADINNFPNIKIHLEYYKPFMEYRRETQKGSNEWFHLHWPRKEKVFLGEKILFPQMCEIPKFAYSNGPFFVNMSTNLIYKNDKDIDLLIFTAVLNSKLAHFWLLNNAKNRGIGIDISVNVIDNFPINKKILTKEKRLSELVLGIINLQSRNQDIRAKEKEIDNYVYDLYNIKSEEQKIIEDYINERIKI